MIPKKIHYCWFGNNKKSKLIKRCIASWKKYFPSFEIIEWNESNTDLEENEYIKKAYKSKMWAYVSDYVHMKVLYQYGGIYFDTDVEVIKKFPQQLLDLNAFSGIEACSLKVSPGLVFGCKPKNKIVKEMIESYRQDVFEKKSIEKMKTINIRITEILLKYGFVEKDEKQEIAGLVIFPSSVFCGYNSMERRIEAKEDTLSVHHYAHSWFPWYRNIRVILGTVKRRLILVAKNR